MLQLWPLRLCWLCHPAIGPKTWPEKYTTTSLRGSKVVWIFHSSLRLVEVHSIAAVRNVREPEFLRDDSLFFWLVAISDVHFRCPEIGTRAKKTNDSRGRSRTSRENHDGIREFIVELGETHSSIGIFRSLPTRYQHAQLTPCSTGIDPSRPGMQ